MPRRSIFQIPERQILTTGASNQNPFAVTAFDLDPKHYRKDQKAMDALIEDEEAGTPSFVPDTMAVWGKSYFDVQQVLTNGLGIVGVTVEQIESALEQVYSELRSLDLSESRRREQIIVDSRMEFGVPIRGEHLSQNEIGEVVTTPVIYLTFRQLCDFIEYSGVKAQLDKFWRETLMDMINQTAPIFMVAARLCESIRAAPGRRLLLSEIKRKNAYVPKHLMRDALAFLTDNRIVATEDWKPSHGRTGTIFYLD